MAKAPLILVLVLSEGREWKTCSECSGWQAKLWPSPMTKIPKHNFAVVPQLCIGSTSTQEAMAR